MFDDLTDKKYYALIGKNKGILDSKLDRESLQVVDQD